MSEDYYDEEYDEYYDEQHDEYYDEQYDEYYHDELDDEPDDIEACEEAGYDVIDDEPHPHDDHPFSSGSDHRRSHASHALLGAAMGYAAAKSLRGNGTPNGRKEKDNVLSDVERERIRRQQQQQAEKQMAETRNGVLGCLLIFLIIILCFVGC